MPEDRRESFYHERIRECGPKYEGFDLASAEAALNLSYTYDVYQQATARYLAEFGLSKSTLNILLVIKHGSEHGMLLHDLGEMLLVSRANITGLIDHLEEMGYVRRVVDVADRRGRYAQLTPEGEKLLEKVMPAHYLKVKQFLSGLSNSEKESLTELLRKMRKSVGASIQMSEEVGSRQTNGKILSNG